MNESREQIQKTIGFKLFGNIAISSESEEVSIDPNKTFDIQFFPGVIPFGIVTQWGRDDEKKVVVELPEEIRQENFEKICLFLLEKNAQLIVKECGFEKLGNRKLVLDLCYDSNEPIVNVTVFVQGKLNSMNYEFELNPYDLSCSVGEIHRSKKYIKANMNLKELMTLKKGDVSKVFAKLKPNNFFVSIEGDYLTIELSSPLKQFIDSLGKPSKYQSQKIENPFSIDAYPDEIVHPVPDEKIVLDKDPKPSKGSMWFRKMIGKG